MSQVLDAYALMVYLEKEPGYEKVRDMFTMASEKDKELLMTTVNWGEVYYMILREHDINKAEEIARLIQILPIKIVDVNLDIAREAASFKALYKLSYADCFAAGLAKLRKAELVTGDKEFKVVEGKIKINWLHGG